MYKFLSTGIFTFLFSINISYAQDTSFSKNSFKFSAGLGFVESYRSSIDGPGTSYAVGYQRDIWRNRLRINPFISVGFFSNKFTTDIPDAYCNSINLQNNLYLDLIKFKSVSFVAGTGLFLNNLRGLRNVRSGSGARYAAYFSEYNFGVNGSVGIRINPKNKRLAFDLMPFNFNFGTNDFSEFTLRLNVDYKLK